MEFPEYLPDIIENYENAAERRLDEMTEGLPVGKFRCACGKIDDLAHAVSATENPYSEPICRKCEKQRYSDTLIERRNAMDRCVVCGKPATYEAIGGPIMQTANSTGDSYGFDRAYPQNKEMRCKEHQSKPDASFGRLWKWRILKT